METTDHPIDIQTVVPLCRASYRYPGCRIVIQSVVSISRPTYRYDGLDTLMTDRRIHGRSVVSIAGRDMDMTGRRIDIQDDLSIFRALWREIARDNGRASRQPIAFNKPASCKEKLMPDKIHATANSPFWHTGWKSGLSGLYSEISRGQRVLKPSAWAHENGPWREVGKTGHLSPFTSRPWKV
jgi:hypothetical protein